MQHVWLCLLFFTFGEEGAGHLVAFTFFTFRVSNLDIFNDLVKMFHGISHGPREK